MLYKPALAANTVEVLDNLQNFLHVVRENIFFPLHGQGLVFLHYHGFQHVLKF